MIKIYGSPRTSAGRCYWALEEAGVAYEAKELDMKNKEHKSPDFLKINPNGKVPALVDGDVTLFESMAINFYIAELYKKEFLGSTSAEKALIMQWSLWAHNELQTPLIDIIIQKVFTPDEFRDQKLIDQSFAKLPNLFEILNAKLEGKKYLVGNDFTLADLNTISVATIASAIGFELKPYAHVTKWIAAASDRPAYQKYLSLRK